MTTTAPRPARNPGAGAPDEPRRGPQPEAVQDVGLRGGYRTGSRGGGGEPGRSERGPGRGPGSAPAPRAGTGIARLVLAQVVGAAGVACSALGLDGLLLGTQWWREVIGAVALVLAIGVVGTLWRYRWWLTSAAQLIGVTALLMWRHDLDLGAVADTVTRALHDVTHAAPPAEATAPMLLLLVGSLALVAVVVDALVRTVPALAGVALLAVLVVAATIDEQALSWRAMAYPAIAYLLVLALTAPLPPGSRRARVHTHSALVVGTGLVGAAALVAASLTPALGEDISTAGRLVRPSVLSGGIGQSPVTGMTGTLLRQEPVDVLTLEGQSRPDYLRAAVLTTWVPGVGWELGELESGEQTAELPEEVDAVTLSSTGYAGRFLPVPDGTIRLDAPPDTWRFDPELRMWHRREAIFPVHYEATVRPSRPAEELLVADTVTPQAEEVALDGVAPEVYELAGSIVAEQATPFEQARALQRWFLDTANEFTYSLTVPAGRTGDPLLDFLELRQGYCEQFASAMAVLARAAGLPARVVVGFGPGSTSQGVTTITSHDAHAWVEVRFDESGWVRFDPTPPVAGQSRQQGWTAAVTTGPDRPEGFVDVDEFPEIPIDIPTAGTDSGAGVDTDTGGSARTGGGWAGWWWLAAALVGLGAVAIGPNAERARRRRVRLRRVARGTSPGTAAWEEIEALAVDHEIPLPAGASISANAHVLERDARLADHGRLASGHLGGADHHGGWGGSVQVARRSPAGVMPLAGGVMSDVLTTVEREWYGDEEAAARRPGDPEPVDLSRTVDVVHQALVRTNPRRGLGRWVPRSLLPARLREVRLLRRRREVGHPH